MKQDHPPTKPIHLFESRKREKSSSGEGTHGKLIVIYGTPLGKQYHLSPQGMTIGRTERSQIFIEDGSVSREHALIERKEGRFILEDLKSTNGTFINGKIVDVRVLNHGDKIRVGNTVLQFVVEGYSRFPSGRRCFRSWAI